MNYLRHIVSHSVLYIIFFLLVYKKRLGRLAGVRDEEWGTQLTLAQSQCCQSKVCDQMLDTLSIQSHC